MSLKFIFIYSFHVISRFVGLSNMLSYRKVLKQYVDQNDFYYDICYIYDNML